MTTEHTRALEAKLAAAEALLAERRAELVAAEAAAREAQAQAWQMERAAKRARRTATPRQRVDTTYQTLDEALTQFQRARAEAQAARKAAKPEGTPVPRGWSPPEDPPFDLAALDLDQVRAMFQALSRRAQELGMPVADIPAIRMAPEDCNALPVPKAWAGADLSGVRAVFQAQIARDVEEMAQDGSARSEALPVACGPDDDDEDPRPKTREQLEQEREDLLRELEREAQEEQAAWREAKRDAHFP